MVSTNIHAILVRTASWVTIHQKDKEDNEVMLEVRVCYTHKTVANQYFCSAGPAAPSILLDSSRACSVEPTAVDDFARPIATSSMNYYAVDID